MEKDVVVNRSRQSMLIVPDGSLVVTGPALVMMAFWLTAVKREVTWISVKGLDE
jgi:hypothetical protein